MIVWVLISLLAPPPSTLPPFWLEAKACERAQAGKKDPEVWACVPANLPVDRK